MIRVGFSIIAMLVAVTVLADEGVLAPRGRWGYGELKFGMTLAEADALRQDDRIEKCDYVGSSRCLVWGDLVFGRKARIHAQIADDTQRITGIVIEISDFSRRRGYPCQAVADDVVKRISDAYGDPKCGFRRINCSWQVEDGGSIGTSVFCPIHDPSSGLVNVRFSEEAHGSE